jgi:pimeloyl-ACP methyl ester carboxylesterase
MKKALKIGAVLLLVLAIGAGVGLWAWSRSRLAEPAAEALAALQSDAAVTVTEGRYIEFRPATGEARVGVIVYPGANCDARGYAQVLRRLAAAGYLVVDVPMPLDLALLAPNRALAVQEAYPDVRRWAIIGHSLGGAMAAAFVYGHPQAVDGLIIWDSYPDSSMSLADWDRPVWHIHRATPDGRPPAAFAERRGLFPASSRWVPVPGGIHMNFGAFDGGAYVETWEPSITRAEQHEQVFAATLEALQAIEAAAGPG